MYSVSKPGYILKTSSRCAKIYPFAVPLPLILVLQELLKTESYLFWKTELYYGELEYLCGKNFFR